MRIGVIGQITQDYFADNVVDALQRMGHSVISSAAPVRSYRHRLSNWITMTARGALPSFDEQAQQRIVRGAIELRLRDRYKPRRSIPYARHSQPTQPTWHPDRILVSGLRREHGPSPNAARAI